MRVGGRVRRERMSRESQLVLPCQTGEAARSSSDSHLPAKTGSGSQLSGKTGSGSKPALPGNTGEAARLAL